MTHPGFHPGERQIQALHGHRERMAAIESQVFRARPLVARRADLVRQFRTVVLATRAGASLWISIEPGPVDLLDEHTIALRLRDPRSVAARVEEHAKVATLLIDHPTASRYRINGRAAVRAGWLVLDAEQAFSNCPVYINHVDTDFVDLDALPCPVARGKRRRLTAADAAELTAADHVYVASQDARGDLDVQYKGGLPGWLHATPTTVAYPEYPGNKWYMTMGNVIEDPTIAVLAPTGLLVQGRATVRVVPADATSSRPSATVRVDVDAAWSIADAGLGPQRFVTAALPADVLLARERRVAPGSA